MSSESMNETSNNTVDKTNVNTTEKNNDKNFKGKFNEKDVKGKFNEKEPMTLKKIIPRDLRPFLEYLNTNLCAYFKLPNSSNYTTKRGINPDGRLLDGHFDIPLFVEENDMKIFNEKALSEPPKGKVEFVGLGISLSSVWKWYLQNKNDDDNDSPAWLKSNACVKPTYSDDQDTRKSQMKAFEKVKTEHCILLVKKNRNKFFSV